MEAFYPEIRWVHVVAVYASGGLFALRGLLALNGCTWPVTGPPRYLSWVIDTTLLTAALMLVTIVRQYPFLHAWLTVKVLLLVVYIVLGYLALRASGSKRAQLGYYLSALAVFGFIVSVARSRHPLGMFS